MDTLKTLNDALFALNAILNIIKTIKGQGGLSDDEIVAAAKAQTGENADLIEKLLADLPA